MKLPVDWYGENLYHEVVIFIVNAYMEESVLLNQTLIISEAICL